MRTNNLFKKLVLFIFITTAAIAAVAQVKDTLFFLNKTLVIGELTRIRLGRIEFDADGIGNISVKYDKINTIRAAKHYFRIETVTDKVYYGTIDSSAIQGSIQIVTNNSRLEMPVASISTLAYYGSDWKTKLSGDVGAGYTFTKSSNIGRLNMNTNVRYHTKHTEALLSGNAIVTKDSTKVYRERENLQLAFNYYLSSRWYAAGLVSYQRNRELGLKSRWQQGLGIGYKYITSSNNQGTAGTGLVLNQEKSFVNNQNVLVEWLLQTNYTLFSFSKPNLTISTSQIFYVNLSQKGRIRWDGDLSINWELVSDLSLKTSFYHNYDKKSPATLLPRLDYGFVAGLSYEF